MAAANPDDRSMLQHAVDYLHAGYPVFPICSPLMIGHKHKIPNTEIIEVCGRGELKDAMGKTPLVRWKGYQIVPPTEDDVRQWWGRWPDANIGFATGELSGILVLDADGGEARQTCLQQGGLDETPTVWTGKVGGAHFHLEYPEGENVRNFARKRPGTDLRGEGGYALLPPSLHASKNRYRWAENTYGIPASAVPPWLTDLIEEDKTESGDSTFTGELDLNEVLTGIKEGKRDDTLYRYACRLRHDNVPRAEAEAMLRLAARSCEPPFSEAVAVAKVLAAYRDFQPAEAPEVDFDREFSPSSKVAPTPAASPPPAVFLRPISELLAMDEVEPDWMVDQLFTVGSNGWVAAEAKVGKSWTVLELIYALSTGSPFLGRFAVKQPRRVIYIQEEDSLQRVLRRLKRLIRGDPSRVNPSDEYLRWAIRAGFKIDSAAWLEKLRQELRAYPAEVVIMDVFNRLHGSDENKQQEMTALLNAILELNGEFGCAFIVVHHNKKAQAGLEARANQMMRGHSVLSGWGECSLYLRRAKEKDTIIVTPESKDAPEIDDFTIRLADQPNGGIALELGDVSMEDQMSKADAAVIEAVAGITARGIGATVKLIAEALGKDRTTVQRRLTKLVTAGVLEVTPISDTSFPTNIYKVVSQ